MSKTPKIESWDIERLVPYDKNAKVHDAEQVGKIAKAIREFGWDQPIVVDKDGVIIKGHGRRLAAISLGMTKVPVLVRSDLTPEQVKAARLSDNRVAQGEIDSKLLEEELRNLKGLKFNLDHLGFDDKELAFLTEDLTEMNIDALIEDLDEEVNEQAERIEATVTEAKERQVKLAEVFGFAAVTVEQSRTISRFMSQLEADTGKKGADALVEFMDGLATSW